MEFAAPLESKFYTVPRETEFNMTGPSKEPGLNWNTKYGYVYLDYFDSKHPVDGMNEKGLSFGFLFFPSPQQKFPSVPQGDEKQALPYTNIGDWLLGNFATIEEVKTGLQNVKIFANPESFPGKPNAVFPIHVTVTDATGKSLVIEFINGKQYVFNNPNGVLTNAPNLDWQLTNIKNYINLSPYQPKPLTIDGYTYSATGNGSGAIGLPGDYSPQSRFVKMIFATQSAIPAKSAFETVLLAQHILNTVDIPQGLVRSKLGKGDSIETTQWVIYKDLDSKILYYKTYDNTNLKAIDLNKINFKKGTYPLTMPLISPMQVNDVTKQFHK